MIFPAEVSTCVAHMFIEILRDAGEEHVLREKAMSTEDPDAVARFFLEQGLLPFAMLIEHAEKEIGLSVTIEDEELIVAARQVAADVKLQLQMGLN